MFILFSQVQENSTGPAPKPERMSVGSTTT